MFALINTKIYDFENFIDNGYIIFDDRIIEVGEMESFKDRGYELYDGFGSIVMPSLTVAHSHLYSALSRGMNVDSNPNNFMEILEQIWWKLDSKLTAEDVYLSGIVSAVEFAKHGVTSIIDHHAGAYIRGSLNLLRKAVCQDVGLRGLFCFETSDRFDINDCIYENAHSADLFGLHASMTLSDDTLTKVKRVLGEKPIHIHAAESWMDQENCISYHGKRVIERLYDSGLLNKNSILAHCIHINENEAELIAKNDCFVALNIRSNMNNSVGLPDYRLLKEKGVKCLIGNDGMSTGIINEWTALQLAMKHRYSSSTAFSMSDLLEIINNNYIYISNMMGIKIGRLKPGYNADLLSIEYNPTTPMDESNAFSHIIYGMSEHFTPEHVWCNGEQIVKHYEVGGQLEKKFKDARKAAKVLWERINGD